MQQRFVSIWFRYLKTDWFIRRKPALGTIPFVIAAPDHGRMVVTAVNQLAQAQGIHIGMTVADARAIIPSLEVLDDVPGCTIKLLTALAEWSIRYTPAVAIDPPGGLLLDVTGCPHLWGGENEYLANINHRFNLFGYHIRTAIADTIGTAWAVAHFEQQHFIVETGKQTEALLL